MNEVHRNYNPIFCLLPQSAFTCAIFDAHKLLPFLKPEKFECRSSIQFKDEVKESSLKSLSFLANE